VHKREGKKVGRCCSPCRGNESGHAVDKEALKEELDVDGELGQRSGG
jgi:hypothetical protein